MPWEDPFMSRFRIATRLSLALAALAFVPTIVAAQNPFIGMYLLFNGHPFDGYHATEYAILYYTPTERAAGNPFVIGWRNGSDHGLLELNSVGPYIVDTVETYDPAGGCNLIGTSGASLTLTPGDTTALTMTLSYRYCPAGVIALTDGNASGTVQFSGQTSDLGFTDSVVDNSAYNITLGQRAGQFPHGSIVTVTLTPAAGYIVQAFGKTSPVGFPITIDTVMNTALTVHASFAPPSSFSIALGSNSPTGTDTVAKGSSKVPMIEFSMNSPSSQTLNTVTVHGIGTGNEHVDVTNVQLYNDANGNGRVDAGEQLLGSTTYDANDGTATLTVAPPFTFSGPTNLLVTYDFSLNIVSPRLAGVVALGLFPLCLVPALRRRRRWMLFGFAMLAISVGALSSCGGDSATGPPVDTNHGSSSYQAEVTNVSVSGTDHAATLTGHTVTILR
jgi:hypothetical protein